MLYKFISFPQCGISTVVDFILLTWKPSSEKQRGAVQSVGSSSHSLLRVGSSDLFSLHSPPHDLIQAHLLKQILHAWTTPICISLAFTSPLNLISSSLLHLHLDIWLATQT